jgi:sugar lactone lactonase YvrE
MSASAATSTSWDLSGFNDILKGRLTGLAVDANGRLKHGLSTRWDAQLGQPALWNVVSSPDGTVYAATGHSGKVFKITPDGKATAIWSAPQAEVFALCIGPNGSLYAATSPSGGLFRIQNGKAEEVWHSSEKYIWALQTAADGSIFIGAGQSGRIYRYDTSGKTALYYETNQSNVTALALGANGHLYAGTDPNGLIYDVASSGHARVVYDSSLPEIRTLAVDSDGTLYAGAMGGAVASRMASGANAAANSAPVAVASTPTVITVTAAKDNNITTAAEEDQATKNADQSKTSTSSASSTSAAASGSVTEVSGVEKSAIYKIRPDGSVETVRSSKEDNVYSLLLDGKALLFSTDDRGRIYRWESGRTSLVSEPGSGETTQLLKIGNDLLAAVSNAAHLIRFSDTGGTGLYESQVHDSSNVARWGHLQWHGIGSGVTFQTRTGYSARPDGTWSDWSPPISNPADALIKSPSARFIQFRASFPASSDAQIDSISVPYLAQNSSPNIRSVTVSSIVGTNAAKTGANTAASNSSTAAYSITVTDTGDAPAASSATSGSQVVSRLQTTQTQISWQADDPDGDKLVYSVYFKAEDENDWQMVRSRMFENTLLLDPDVFADGRYFFRVVASDAPSNAPDFAHQTELISTPILIDNTPPVVSAISQRRNGTNADIEIEARDQTSPLRLCDYSLDAGSWQPIESVDGITDSPAERYQLHLEKLRPSEHLVVFRVYDTAGNAGLAKVLLR